MPVIAESCQSFALDNGAFSEWTKSGGPIDIPAYTEWVDEWRSHPGFDWCLIPDKIGGTVQENAKLINDWMVHYANAWRVNSVPVWHLHEPIEWLEWLAGMYRTVALGSSGQWRQPGTEPWWGRVNQAMKAVCLNGRPRCRIHGLRMLDPAIFSRLPFASADSTNAAMNAGSTSRFGSYPPPEAWQRATVIADRIEAFNSSPAWVERQETQSMLWETLA